MAAGCITHPSDSTYNHVGGPYPGMRVRLRDVPEMGYLSTDNPPRGEIQFTGPTFFSGYYKDPEKTNEAFDGEWVSTGDIGTIFENGSIRVTDRAKNIFKLA
jgi:long-chain acyl-CoA synthetase